MKQTCLLCGRTSPDKNLYCQETFCPAEMSPTILDYGEWLGDIEIVKAVIVLRSAVLYEATHQKQTVYLKVAHPGEENKERLKREAEFLQEIQLQGDQSKFLPSLRPPYANTSIKEDAYGRIILQGHLLYFYLFDYFDGEPLRSVITQNPQLWINHVGWIMISLSTALAFLHSKGLYHYGLSPDAALVRFEENPSVPRLLLFDLGLASTKDDLQSNWAPYQKLYHDGSPIFVLPAYTAPELIKHNLIRPDYRTDVYGLGLTLYELLIGEPPYTFKLHSDLEVYDAVMRMDRVRMNRAEDARIVAEIAEQTVHPQTSQRLANAAQLAERLIERFGPVPQQKKRRIPTLSTLMRVVIILLGVAFVIALIITLSTFAT
ncbi:protein kinase [Chloroflexi bacterium TSY]|nr:protein kinase [Chloroflexi bacterium TSY]